MTELYAFRAIRSPQRVEPDDDSVMLLMRDESVPKTNYTHGFPEYVHWGGSTLLEDLLALAADAELSTEARADEAQVLADKYLGAPGAVDEKMLAGGLHPRLGTDGTTGDPFPGQDALSLLANLDSWLISVKNRPGGAELDDRLNLLVANTFDAQTLSAGELLRKTLEDRRWLWTTFGSAWSRLVDSLAAALLLPLRGELAQRLTRLLLVAGLIDMRSRIRGELPSDRVWRLLALRSPLLPDPPFPRVLPHRRVQLVRQSTVSDLFVVRQEWRCYVAGEVADIRNVLAGEHQDQRTVRIDEREVLDVMTEETMSMSETSSETGEQSSFSEETQRQMSLALHADGQIDVSGQYGPTKVDASAGFSADFSLEDATNRATQVAKSAVARAASRVETRTRRERNERILTRFEDVNHHDVDNETDEHVRGVYRWVNRIDRLQVWRYPDRLQLEFQLPEPGRFLLAQLSEPRADPGALPHPGDFTVTTESITAEGYLALAAQYGATGLPEPPEPTLGVSETLTVVPTGPLPSSNTALWNAESATERKEIAIPPGYVATNVTVEVTGSPIHGVWRREQEPHKGWDDLERYHTITASVAVGDKVVFTKQVGPQTDNATKIQSTGSEVQPKYLEAHLHGSAGPIDFGTPLVGKAPVTLIVTGAASATSAVELTCKLTNQAEAQWRQDVFDGLRAAYDIQFREWRAEQARTGPGSSTLQERSPARHAEMIRAELKRHIVAWLLGESPFAGRPAVASAPAGPASIDETPDVDVDRALKAAPDIQFLEQCLEWANLTYVAYPYYWADRDRWKQLMDMDTVDPELGRFLRAGSMRVVVPARPGFAAAVQHWLLFRQPWFGGCSPIPGSPLHVSVAKEIRDQTEPPPDGEPGESWEIVLPTTLLWLDEDAVLPANQLARLGVVPHAPAQQLCVNGKSAEVYASASADGR